MEHVDVEGLTIAFERVGAGPELVFLHGGMVDHREWEAQLAGLSDTYTVIAWDAPGCGASSVPPPSFRMPDYARVLASLLDRIGVDRAHVGGLSWGSTLALELYRQRPERFRSLVLTAAYAGWAGSLPPEEVQDRLTSLLRDVEERAPAEWMADFLPTLVTDAAPEELRASILELMVSATRKEGVPPMLHAMAEADMRPVLSTISVPTLLLYGAHDVRSPREVAEAMRRAIPGSTLVVLDGSGHQANIEAADAFNGAVRAFLSTLE